MGTYGGYCHPVAILKPKCPKGALMGPPGMDYDRTSGLVWGVCRGCYILGRTYIIVETVVPYGNLFGSVVINGK